MTESRPGEEYELERRVGTFQKVGESSVINLLWNGSVSIGEGELCDFQLRVDDEPNSAPAGERGGSGSARTVLRGTAGMWLPASAIGAFERLPAGEHEVSIWVRADEKGSVCLDNPGDLPQTVLAQEIQVSQKG